MSRDAVVVSPMPTDLIRDGFSLITGKRKLEEKIAKLELENAGLREELAECTTTVVHLNDQVNDLENELDLLRPTDAWLEEEDLPLPEDPQIERAFPTRSGRHDLYKEAMRFVGARYTKAGLVGLVTWLLLRIDVKDKILAESVNIIGGLDALVAESNKKIENIIAQLPSEDMLAEDDLSQ